MAFKALTVPATFTGPAADRTAQLEECAIGDYWFDEDDGFLYRKSANATPAWVKSLTPVSTSAGIGDRTPAHTAPTATNATSAMLAANTGRKAALLQNIGSVDVFINLGAAAVANTGILLQANGGSFNMSDVLGNLDVAAINGITASGSAIVLVTEWS